MDYNKLRSERLGFDVETFLKDYNAGEICLSGEFRLVNKLFNALELDYSDYYEENLNGVISVEKCFLYIANRKAFGESFVNLLRYRQVQILDLPRLYPIKKYCECCGQELRGE